MHHDEWTQAEKVLNLYDLLGAEIEDLIQEQEHLQDAYMQLQQENEALKDTIAELMGKR
jgi:hypothetical protein